MTRPNRRAHRRPRNQTTSSDRLAGRITGVFGLRGELKCDPTSAGRTVFYAGARLRMRHRDRDADVTVTGVREHKGRLLISLENVASADEGQALIGAEFLAPRDAFVLGPDEYLDEDLIGCALCDRSGAELGRVSSIEHYPGQDLLLVNGARIPLVRAFINGVDVSKKKITVDLPRGLLDPREADEA